jgi:hypothetical protein
VGTNYEAPNHAILSPFSPIILLSARFSDTCKRCSSLLSGMKLPACIKQKLFCWV